MKNEIAKYDFHTPFGVLTLGDYQGKLIMADWKFREKRNQIDQRIKAFTQANFVEKITDLHHETIKQYNAYFAKKLKVFNLPLFFAGTEFQQQVWGALRTIPYGKTMSYDAFTSSFTSPKAIRAVATANGMNALSIIVPCHRIIGKNGDLVGYAGGLSVKRKLLALEQNQKQLSLF